MAEAAGATLRRETETARESNIATPWLHVGVFLVAVLVVISRRPDAVTNPQFWAEDGLLWFAQAHNLGWWRVLFQPETGYFCTLPRLTAALAQLLPLAAAPLLFNLVAILFQVLPVSFFLSSRFASLGTQRSRLLLGFLYLALPNSFEVNANVTNAQWHLALLACLVVLAEPARSLGWRCFDFVVMVLSALTGPFAIMLLPVAGIAWGWKRRTKGTLILLLTLAAGVLLQVSAFLRTGSAARMQGSLGANPILFAKVLSSQVFLAALIGKNNLPYRHSYIIYAVLITIGGITVLIYALLRARWELKLFIVFASLVLTAALLHPMAHAPQWLELLSAWGVRYWLLPMLAFVSALVWMAGNHNPRAVRFIAVVALLLMSVGIVREWRYPGFADLQFGIYARQFSDLPKGSSLTIPLNPQGWSMTLEKR
ncbi:MAG TPA: hypothetical protein VK738_12540 [Terriglobales bacterium]|nr:hypothetical protein [Terriglobales bacterium]